ncbi:MULTISPECIES: tetratricopeptide repeat protein [unclassified Bacteroides]|jgi:tetratricopeptide (TPR) repeat protein|uniref:tetratricopeptide repeat protein n=1 Tax=unclassified Bacteroides TaxID=2646097 RepID=UPI000E8E9DA6|nr:MULTISPECIES: tetratricopeptide repeat protein [unclassified Bacteroides]RGN51250.1 hypothetical protein DXB63_00545 [Bacteroides sp. OM05-12]RHR78636.1 hypothetical protein DWW69_04195 [Bacteroides sp. AF16-49]
MYAQQDCDALIESAVEAADKNDFVTSLELLSKAKVMAESRHLPKEQFKILSIMGVNQAKMLNYSDALENFMAAYKIAVNELDVKSEMRIMNNIGSLYLLDHKYNKANEYYKKVYDYAKDTKDTIFTGGCIMNIVLTASYMENVKEAEKFLQVASNLLKNYPNEMLRVKSLTVCNLRQKKEYASAESLALELLPQFQNSGDQELKTGVVLELVEVYKEEKRFDEAIRYAEEALGYNINIESKKDIFALLSDLYKESGAYRKAIAYKDSFIYALDSLNVIKDQKRFENTRIKFELLKNEKELSDSQAKLKILWIVFILSGLMVLILIWAFVNKLARDKQRKKIIELELKQEKNDKLILENKLKEQETLALLEQERLKNEQEKLEHEIELKNKELVSKALFLANRNELIANLVNTLSESQDLSANPKLKDNIRQLKNQLRENGEWDSFMTHFEQTNQRFIVALREKHPSLTANEVRFLSFIYINLNTKEISSLLNITPEYCKKKKQQISQKMGLTSTSLLYSYLFSL